MAKIAGIKSGSTITKLESGIGVKLNFKMINKIADGLSVSLDDLLSDSLDCYSLTNKLDNIMSLVDGFDERKMKMYIDLLDDYSKEIK